MDVPATPTTASPSADTLAIATPLAVLPSPKVPAAFDGGLGYNDVARNPEDKVVVQVGPWPDFQDGDTLMILWGLKDDEDGTPVATQPASLADAYKIVDVYVTSREIARLGSGPRYVGARVIHRLGLPSNSPRSPILVKLDVPGGHDPIADSPYVNESLLAPEVLPPRIDPPAGAPDPAAPAATVRIAPYANMAEGDMLTVRWNIEGNEIAYGPVTQDEVDAQATLEITIDRATVDAGGSGDAVRINYYVYDRAHNWSLWSLVKQVEVVDPKAPQAPWVEGTVDDAGEILDVDTLGTDPATVLVEGSGALKGDSVIVHWGGATAAGLPVTTYDTDPQAPSRPGQTLSFSIPNLYVKPLAQGTVRAWYTIDPVDGSKQRISARRNLAVNGSANAPIPPRVSEAKGELLDPADVTGDVAHGIVPAWDGMQPGDDVTLVGEGKKANGDPTRWDKTQHISGNMQDKDVPIGIPREVIDILLDGSLRLYYVITPYGTARQGRTLRQSTLAVLRSDPLDLSVRTAGAQPKLQAPDILHLDADNVLDPETYTTSEIQIPAYNGITAKDRVDVAIRGGLAPFADWTYVNSPATPPSFPLLEDFIADAGNHDRTLIATYTASRTGYLGNSNELAFRIGVPVPFAIDGSPVELVGTEERAREATGGKQPYTYLSNNTSVVVVPDQASGLIRAVSDGNATITARDDAGASGTYPVRVTGNTLVLLRPEPDFLVGETIDIGNITDPQGLRVVVRQYQGMAALQAITLECLAAVSPSPTIPSQTVSSLRDYEFFVPMDYLLRVAAMETPRMRFAYSVNVAGTLHDAPPTDVSLKNSSLEPLHIDNEPLQMILGGDDASRRAEGGVPPYRYTSSNAQVVTVNDSDGTTIAHSQGRATITVTDSAAARASYTADVHLPPMLTENFSSAPLGQISAELPLELPSMKISHNASGLIPFIGTAPAPAAPELEGSYLSGYSVETPVELSLTYSYSKVSFGAGPAGLSFAAYDREGTLVAQHTTQTYKQTVTLIAAPAGKRIKRIAFFGNGGVDNFVLTP
jgi:hypothetical protein